MIADAEQLIAEHGDLAYAEARSRARQARETDHAADLHWSRVAVLIAERTGREIGVKGANRYERS